MASPTDPSDSGGGTRVAGGRHIVPRGIAVERLVDDGHKELKKICPPDVQELLEAKGLMEEYDKLIKNLIKNGRKSAFDGPRPWSENKIVSIIQDSRSDGVFAAKNVQVSLCMYHYYSSGSMQNLGKTPEDGVLRWLWLEFFDTTSVEIPRDYISPFDISDFKAVFKEQHLIPPSGVVVVDLNDFHPKHIITKIPDEVMEFMQKRGLMDQYNQLAHALYETKGTRSRLNSWGVSNLGAVVDRFHDAFSAKHVEVIVCKIPPGEWDNGTKWIEIIDRSEVPESVYWPKHDVDEDRVSERVNNVAARHGAFTPFTRSSSLSLPEEKVPVAVEPLVINGQSRISSERPPELEEFLIRKDLLAQHDLRDHMLSACKTMRNFVDIWRMSESGIIEFPLVKEFQSAFLRHGVKLILCESVGVRGEKHYWLEYVDMELEEDYSTPFDICWDSVGTQSLSIEENGEKKTYKKVAGGRHFVPEGVAVEELEELTKITDGCPGDVRELLISKGLMVSYESFIDAIARSKKTRGWADNWKGEEIRKIMDEYAGIFESQGVKLVLCKLKPNKGKSYRWFEFIDKSIAPSYVAQYDISNFEDEPDEIKTSALRLKFPIGVAVERLRDQKAVVGNVPESVRIMMEAKDCFDLYVSLMDVLYQSGGMNVGDGFSENQVRTIARVLGPKFEAKGVGVFFSAMKETDDNGKPKPIFWLEFVDRDLQPNYFAQRGIDVQKFPSEGISKEEAISLALKVGFAAASIAIEMAARS